MGKQSNWDIQWVNWHKKLEMGSLQMEPCSRKITMVILILGTTILKIKKDSNNIINIIVMTVLNEWYLKLIFLSSKILSKTSNFHVEDPLMWIM